MKVKSVVGVHKTMKLGWKSVGRDDGEGRLGVGQ